MSTKGRSNAQFISAIWADLLQGFWDERGTGARYRTVEAGVDWFAEDLALLSPPADPESALSQAAALIRKEEIATEVAYELKNDFADYAELRVRGCMLHAGERMLQKRGCEPYACVVANLAMNRLEKCPELSSELARVDVTEEGCTAQIVFFREPK